MGPPVSVRLDDDALPARSLTSNRPDLESSGPNRPDVESSGLSRSDAIRLALVEAAQRRRRDAAVRAEVLALDADEDDRREMLAVASLMESMRAPR